VSERLNMIQFRNVSKVYDNGVTVLQSANFDINDGEFVFIYGDEGSGKSTVLNLILREELPTVGQVFINGADISRFSEREITNHRRKIGFIFYDDKLLINRTVRENIEFVLNVTGKKVDDDKIKLVLDMFNLTAKQNSYPSELSGGEKRKVAIARAYVIEPAILLADEPASHMDTITAEFIIKILLDINRSGTSVIFTTSNLNFVEKVGKRIIRI